jgi:hypothetical protein
MGKIGPMYAAHELRFRVQRLVTQVRNHSLDATPQWRQNLSQAIRDVWGPQVCRVFPDFPKLNVGQFPNLKVIFDIDADGAVSFLKGTEPDPDKAVHDVGELNPPTDKQAFDDWMRNMVLWSNNSAAGRVISALGYPYLNRLLRVAGFFNPDVKPGAGLWVSGNYATKTKDWEPGTDLLTLTARGQQHYKATTNFAATGQDVARLLAMAALRKLFDEDAQTCDDMVNLMSKPVPGGPAVPGGPGVKSFIRIALALGAPGTIGSKIGIGVPDPRGTVGVHDCAIVSRTAAGGTALRYVAVILGGYLTPGTADADSAFNDAVVAVDTSVLAMH